MKLLCTMFCLGFAVISAGAGDVQQRRAEEVGKNYKVYGAFNGQVYRNATVTKVTDAGVTLRHEDGIARLDYDALSPEQRETFGMTREVAEAIYAREEYAKAAYEALVAAKEEERLELRQHAHEEKLAKLKAARLEAELRQVERLLAQRTQTQNPALTSPATPNSAAQPVQAAQNSTSIVSTVELPQFPIIRGHDSQILYPIQNTPRRYRSSHYGSSSHYGYPVRYGGYHGGYGYGYYPSRCGSYGHGYRRGSWGAINYNGGNWSIGIRW